jgi:hypothetical protein
VKITLKNTVIAKLFLKGLGSGYHFGSSVAAAEKRKRNILMSTQRRWEWSSLLCRFGLISHGNLEPVKCMSTRGRDSFNP